MSQYGTFSNEDMENYVKNLIIKKKQKANMGDFAYQDNVDYSGPVWENFLKGRQAMSPEDKQRMIDNRLSDNYRISLLAEKDKDFKAALKSTSVRKQLAKKLQYQKMQRKLLSMSPAPSRISNSAPCASIHIPSTFGTMNSSHQSSNL